jgi:hypothetical protein
MWFRVFVVLRFPVSVIFLFGYCAAFGVQMVPFNGPDLSFLLVPLLLGACIFPVVASVMLIRRRTLWLAWWSLGLETVGAVMLGYAVAELNAQAFGPLTALAVLCVVGVAWTLPNAVVFNKQWAKLAEGAEPTAVEK